MSRRACRDKQWMTPALKISSHRKNALYRKWIMFDNNDEFIYKRYKQIFHKIANKA